MAATNNTPRGDETMNDAGDGRTGEQYTGPGDVQRGRKPFPVDLASGQTWRSFFRLTGGSMFYCISAVLVAYGIVKVMGPVLAGSTSFSKALPPIITLHIYEIALLGVLLLIVSRRVVDDAISLVIIMALFLVGTSAAQGTVADRNISASLAIGLIGVLASLVKLILMRRFARIRFAAATIAGLVILMACNYIGPVLLARCISADPSDEPARREMWMLVWLGLLVAGAIVLVDAMQRSSQKETQVSQAFLQRPVMAYVLALILLITSGAHQYGTAFTFALERALGDFAPIGLLVVLLVLEILRHLGKRFGYTELLMSCAPIAVMLYAIYQRQAPAYCRLGFGIIAYPPIFFALSGLAVAAVSLYHRWYRLLYVTCLHVLGVILTYGFSPEHPHDLHFDACLWTLATALILYGLIIRNQFSYAAGLIALCFQLEREGFFADFVKMMDLTQVGAIAGVCGIGIMVFYFLFASRLARPLQILGGLALAVFIYDYLPDHIHWEYIPAVISTGSLMGLLWVRRKDSLLMEVIGAPFVLKLYIVTKPLAYWRPIIAGFLALAAGAAMSLRKRPESKVSEDQIPGQSSGG